MRARQEKYQKSVLDAVMEDASAGRRVGHRRQQEAGRVHYGVRDIERAFRDRAHQRVNPPIRKTDASPGELRRAHGNLFDLMTAAFQTDSTRIVTFLMAIERAPRVSGDRIPDSHHG